MSNIKMEVPERIYISSNEIKQPRNRYGAYVTRIWESDLEYVLPKANNGWISLLDKSNWPEMFQEVFMYTKKGRTCFSRIDASGEFDTYEIEETGNKESDIFTHWMPKPLPPQ